MKKPTDELRRLKAEKDAAFTDAINHLESVGKESLRIGEQFDNIGRKKREDDKKYGKDKIDDKTKKEAEKDYSENEYRTVLQILFRPVPYDAMESKVPVPVQLHPNNHRAYTLGHDEVLGWLFGTVNTMTRSLTYKLPGLNTFTVQEKGNIMNGYSDIITKVKEAYHIFNIEHERLYAAVFKQGLHFLADKYTKTGLPLPFMSAEEYLEKLKQGWDAVGHANSVAKFKKITGTVAKDVGIVAIQFMISLIINEIIKAVHLFLHDEKTDGDIKLYQVRTRKILLTANCVSSSSNVLFSAGVAIATKNPLEGAKRLDMGGFIETIHRLVSDTKFIAEIKREYIQEKLYERIYDSDFNWLYQQEE